MKYLFIFLVLINCGKAEKFNNESFPENRASAEETEALKLVLNQIQSDFDEQHINIDLESIPYSINDLGEFTAGICYKSNGRRIGIAIDHTVFLESIENGDYYGFLYKVLLHEIGHCFFNRIHEENNYSVTGYTMLLGISPGRAPKSFDSIATTVMESMGQRLIPKLLWPYYIKEMVGLDLIQSWEDFRPYINISIRPVSG